MIDVWQKFDGHQNIHRGLASQISERPMKMSFNPLLGLKNQGGPLALTSWGPTSCKLVYKSQQLYKHHKPEFIGVMKWLSYCKRGPVFCSTYFHGFHGAWGGPRVLERNMPLPILCSVYRQDSTAAFAAHAVRPLAILRGSHCSQPKIIPKVGLVWILEILEGEMFHGLGYPHVSRNDEKRWETHIWIHRDKTSYHGASNDWIWLVISEIWNPMILPISFSHGSFQCVGKNEV